MSKKISLNELRKIIKNIIKENEHLYLDKENDFFQYPDINKKIKATYAVTDEESSQEGDFKEQGWYDEEGLSMTPDEFDKEEGITAIEKAVDFLVDQGATEPSSTSYHENVWFSTPDPEINYSTGENTYYSFHLEGFSPEEKQEIFNRINQIRKNHLS